MSSRASLAFALLAFNATPSAALVVPALDAGRATAVRMSDLEIGTEINALHAGAFDTKCGVVVLGSQDLMSGTVPRLIKTEMIKALHWTGLRQSQLCDEATKGALAKGQAHLDWSTAKEGVFGTGLRHRVERAAHRDPTLREFEFHDRVDRHC